MQRFVLRNGSERKGVKYAGKRGKPKMCFMNAANMAMSHSSLTYQEGYIDMPGIDGFNIHHAWCIDGSGNVVDSTLSDPQNHTYFGVSIPLSELQSELVRLGHYGILDTPSGINHKWIFKHDPQLKAIVDQIIAKRRPGQL